MSSTKSGYDYNFVDPPPKSLECAICLLVLKDPHVISCCGNHFCKPCIERVRRDGKPCPLCNDPDYSIMLHKGVMREVNSLMIWCPQKPLGCEWTGELGQLASHENLGSKDSGCGFIIMECTHQCGEKLQRRNLLEHETESCLSRPMEVQFSTVVAKLDLMSKESAALKTDFAKKLDVVMTANNSLSVKCKTLEERNSELEMRNEFLTQAVEEMREKMNTVELEKGILKERVAALESLAQKLFQVENRLKLESKRLDQVKKSAESENRQLDQKLHSLESRVFNVPPFYFTLFNFQFYQDNDLQWMSRPFYTSPRGYKLNVIMYPNGTSRGKGTHLSIYASILQGEFDDELEWPFQGNISIQIYNYETSLWECTVVIKFEESDDVSFTGRPVESYGNPGLGFSQWMTLSSVGHCYFLKGMVRFRVSEAVIENALYLAVE